MFNMYDFKNIERWVNTEFPKVKTYLNRIAGNLIVEKGNYAIGCSYDSRKNAFEINAFYKNLNIKNKTDIKTEKELYENIRWILNSKSNIPRTFYFGYKLLTSFAIEAVTFAWIILLLSNKVMFIDKFKGLLLFLTYSIVFFINMKFIKDKSPIPAKNKNIDKIFNIFDNNNDSAIEKILKLNNLYNDEHMLLISEGNININFVTLYRFTIEKVINSQEYVLADLTGEVMKLVNGYKIVNQNAEIELIRLGNSKEDDLPEHCINLHKNLYYILDGMAVPSNKIDGLIDEMVENKVKVYAFNILLDEFVEEYTDVFAIDYLGKFYVIKVFSYFDNKK